MKKIIAFLFISFGFFVQSQVAKFEWVKPISGLDAQEIIDVVCDKYNNVYYTGYFLGTVDFNPGQQLDTLTATQETLFILKFNGDGQFLWVKSMGVNSSNDPEIEITDNDELLFINHSGDFTKLDLNGNVLVSASIYVPGSYKRISVDANGNIYLTGYFTLTRDFDPGVGVYNLTAQSNTSGFFAKYSSNFELIWAKEIGGPTGPNGQSGLDIRDSGLSPTGDLVISGVFGSIVDFDPGVGVNSVTPIYGTSAMYFAKYSGISGNLIWVKQIYNVDGCEALTIDSLGNILITGHFAGTVDFDPGPGQGISLGTGIYPSGYLVKYDGLGQVLWANNILDYGYDVETDSNGNVYVAKDGGYVLNGTTYSGDVGVLKFTSDGNPQWIKTSGGIGVTWINNLALSSNGNIYVGGHFFNQTLFQEGSQNYSFQASAYDGYCLKINEFSNGLVFIDYNQNGNQDANEFGYFGAVLTDNSTSLVSVSDQNGNYLFDNIPIGNNAITIGAIQNYTITTPNPQSAILLSNQDDIQLPSFGVYPSVSCTNPDVSLYTPQMRQGLASTFYVSACNNSGAIDPMLNAWVDVELDPQITLNASSIAYTTIGTGLYRFNIGNLNPNQCVDFTFNATISGSIGQTLCANATLFPNLPCNLDTIPSDPIDNGGSTQPGGPLGGIPEPCTLPWDHSSLTVNGWCQNDSIYFYVENHGSGDMSCYAPVTITINGIVTYTDSILLVSGQGITYSFAGNGETWILNAEQHPLHQGCSHPNAHVEGCGGNSSPNPGSGCVNDFRLDDADPIVDIYCGTVTGNGIPHDPNDKTGYPNGYSTEHYINSNQQLQYVIRFQNTGTDTAFNVLILDTLDFDLNISTVVSGVASHPYEFRMYGPRVLEWRFNNIMLPDSAANLEGSNGFVTFHVEQLTDLLPGTIINNDADVYFDTEAPVTTNETWHTIYNGFFAVAGVNELDVEGTLFKVYPNPVNGQLTIESGKMTSEHYQVFDQMGKKILSGKLSFPMTTIDASSMNQGVYFIQIGENKSNTFKIVKL